MHTTTRQHAEVIGTVGCIGRDTVLAPQRGRGLVLVRRRSGNRVALRLVVVVVLRS
jgi:hypothetical protein